MALLLFFSIQGHLLCNIFELECLSQQSPQKIQLFRYMVVLHVATYIVFDSLQSISRCSIVFGSWL